VRALRLEAKIRGQTTEDRSQRSEDGGQRIEENFELRISDLEIGEGVSGQ